MKEVKSIDIGNGMKEIIVVEKDAINDMEKDLNAPFETWESFKNQRDAIRSKSVNTKNPIKKIILKIKMNKLRKKFGLRAI